MERRVLKRRLEEAARRMLEGAWRVARQKELAAEVLGRGVDVGPYRPILTTFEDTLRPQIQHVQSIKRELYGLSLEGEHGPATGT
jgi:hypothetical protein